MSDLQFDHIALSVSNVARTLEFYQSNFDDVKVLHEDESWALISLAGVKIAFVIPDQHPPHISLRLTSRASLEVEAARHGKRIVLHRDKSESFYITDPDGNSIELISYPEKTA